MGASQTVYDRVVSSYVPSVRAIEFLHSQKTSSMQSSSTKNPKALIFTVTKMVGNEDKENAEKKAQVVRPVLDKIYSITRPESSTSSVIPEWLQTPLAHFACHRSLNVADPFKNKIYLEYH